MIKYYALGMFFCWAALLMLFSTVLGMWGGLPAGVLVTAGLVLMSRSSLRSASTAGSAAVVAGLATVVGTVIALVNVAVHSAHSGTWWPTLVESLVAVLLVVAAVLVVRRARSRRSRDTHQAGRAG
jgi:hypothetical protein